ncbi:non-ribosomal peptide synthetase [Aquimarina aquimarini]|uniref:non-ribosomal peptide synthetase n=1 Tax=Aquimarina aquimarini TaxID=1191734 RepID=UPI000D551D4C|nr:non-ribosomal peptide synthetase [Aquimarina aquimarini]
MNTLSLVVDILDNAKKYGVQLFLQQGELKLKKQKGVAVPVTIIELIKDNKVAITQFLKEHQSAHKTGVKKIHKSNNDATAKVLSFNQERIWFIDKLQGSTQYHMPFLFSICELIDLQILNSSFKEVIRRHETLRTVFYDHNGIAEQKVQQVHNWNLEQHDFTSTDHELEQYLQKLIQTPFDLSVDYSIKVHFIKVADTDFKLLILIHHIAFDGQSLPILLQELSQIYQTYMQGASVSLPEPSIQYSDYALWERDVFKKSGTTEKLRFWKEYLQEVAPLHLPLKGIRPTTQSVAGDRVILQLNKKIKDQIIGFSKANKVTPYIFLLSVFKIIMARYSSQEDICIGSPFANRNQEETTSLLGFFVNTLPIRTFLPKKTSFIELLSRVKASLMKVHEHQEVPFSEIVNLLGIERDLSKSPLFQTIFTYTNSEEKKPFLLGETIVVEENSNYQVSKYDLAMEVEEHRAGMTLTLEYCTDLFHEKTISTMLSHYQQVLESAIAQPTSFINDLKLISKEEEKELINSIQVNTIDYALDKNVIDRFCNIAKKTPESISICFEGHSFSYQEIDKQSNQLANYLIAKDIREGDVIPICLDRSTEMIISVLAVLKTGAAYVPIDPSYPKERIDFILEDTKAKILITNTESYTKNSLNTAVTIIEIDEVYKQLASYSHEAITTSISSDQLAYVIYTSGTTGVPKGVMISHKGLSNLCYWHQDAYDVKPSSKATLLSGVGFDASVWEIFPYLTIGASVFPITNEQRLETEMLIDFINTNKITHGYLPPVLYKEVIAEESKEFHSEFKALIGGEALIINRHKKNVTPYNNYGPTENTVVATYYKVKENEVGAVPIGKAINNVSLYVVDENLSILPPGITGELCIAGDQLALGYWNRPKLTEEKFVENPFKTNTKLYKTGDLVRVQHDGNIQFIGRKDNQVQVRGYRVEPGEIESRIEELDEIKQALVIAKEDLSGNNQLVAYLLPQKQLNVSSIKALLKESLPSYMLPKNYVEVASFPMTANGKIDIKALPVPTIITNQDKEYIAPVSLTQRQLVSIWQELLGSEKIGVTDNFFECGGDSIKAIQLVSRAKNYKLYFKVKDVFRYQTILELEQQLDKQTSTLREEGILKGTFGLLPIQKMFFEMNLENYNHYNQSMLFSIKEELTYTQLSKAVSILIQQHDALRLSFEYQDVNTVTQQYTTKEIPLIKEEASSDKEVTALCKKYQQELDSTQGEPIKVIWISKTENGKQNLLFFCAHHLVIDGVSWRILLEDLNEILNGNDPSLSNKTTSYRQWQSTLETAVKEELFQSEIPYWTDVISYKKPFPVEKKSDKELTYQETKYKTQSLSSEKTTSLVKEAHTALGTDMNDILLSALAMTLCSQIGEENIVIGVEGHGREEISNQIDLSKTVGWFTSLFPVCLSIPKEVTDLKKIIADTKENLRGIPNKGLGYGVLRYLEEDPLMKEKLSANFDEILFNYLGSFESSINNKSLFSLSEIDKGSDIGESNKNPYKIAINSIIIEGQLQMNWSYDSLRFSDAMIDRLSSKYLQNLEQIIDFCKSITTPVKTASDYGLSSEISYSELEKFHSLSKHSSKIEDIYPLSPLQKGMLFHSQYGENKGAYVVQFSFDITSGFDVEIFKTSWKYLSNKHTILRTAFFSDYFKDAVQCVYKEVTIPTKIIDHSNDTLLTEEDLHIIKKEERILEFDMSIAPLVRFTIIKLPENKIKLLITNHHILWDGWSFASLFSSFVNIYNTISEQKELPVLEVDNYGDLIRKNTLEDTIKSQAYWKKYLEPITASTFLPFVKDPSKRNKLFGDTISTLDFDEQFTQKLITYTQQKHVTQSTLIQGVWSYLLSKYNGTDTVGFGATISGRSAGVDNIEKRVGLYINTIPVINKVSDDMVVSDWLQKLQKEHTTSREEYGNLSLNDIQSTSSIKGSLFDTIVVFENYPVDEKSLNEQGVLSITNIDADEYGNFVLSLSVAIIDNKLKIKFTYHHDLLEHHTVKMIKGHLKQTLLHIVDGATTIGELDYISQEEYKTLVSSFNQTLTTYPNQKTIIELFEEQVLKNPDKTALVYGDKQLTYQELFDESNLLAQHLLSQGVIPGDTVGILAKRGIEMMIGIFGVLQCRGVYVPLHMDYPTQRLEYILEDAAVAKIICTDKSLISEKELSGYEFILIEELERGEVKPLQIKRSANSLAYIMYTSGTTGAPKGVQVTHQNIIKLVYDKGAIAIQPEDHVLQWSNFAFDGSVYEIFSTLLKGASLHLIHEAAAPSAIQLTKLIKEQKITVCFVTTALFNSFVDNDPEIFKHLRKVLFGGELVSVPHVKKALEHSGENTIIHVYGPTETVVYATSYPINTVQDDLVPIGKPLSNTQVYVLDAYNKLCPIGVEGELYIGGDGVSKGYLNKPELTRERFVPNPFNNKEGVLYKTGDLVKRLSDGTINFIGRKDAQVKIRGYRIELGEIETVLQELDLVKQAIVIAFDDPGGSKRLAAYIIPEGSFDKSTIHKRLEEKLPEYMIPPFMIPMDSYPLTPNGKVDKKELPSPLEKKKTWAPQHFVNSIEIQLIQIWKEVLNLDSVGIEEEFFELGGHSLLATQMGGMIRKTFDVVVDIKDIFEHDTIAKLSALIESKSNLTQQQLIEIWKEVLSLDSVGIEEEFFELGGHSLLATQMGGMIRKTFDVAVDIKDIFEHDTIAKLSALIESKSNPTQQQLIEIWKEVLNLDSVGIDEEFFELGGHSLLATQMGGMIRKTFDVAVDIKDIFEHDTIAKLSEFITTKNNRKEVTDKIEVQECPEHIPLSYSQERLWFLDQLEGSNHYHIPVVLEITGELDISLLETSIQEIVNRHEPLRTIFYEYKGQGFQKIVPENEWMFTEIIQLSDDKKEEEILKEKITLPFDLSSDYMLKAYLLEKTTSKYTLIFVFHHIAADGNLPLFFNELSTIYNANIKNTSPTLNTLPIQYIEYAIWQREYLQGEVLTNKLAYWIENLQDSTPLELPTDFARPSIRSTKGNTITVDIEKELSENLIKLAKQEDVTLYMLMLSVLNVLMYRYSGQTDINIGSPVANRKQKEIQQLIGFFVNTIVIRSHVDTKHSFIDFLQTVKFTALSAYQHEDVPFEQVVNVLDDIRDRSRTPLFQVLFSLQNLSENEAFPMEGLVTKYKDYEYQIAKYDLTFIVIQKDEHLSVAVEYCTDLFADDTIHKMTSHYIQLLQSVVANPSHRIDQLTLLSVSEQNYLLDKLSTGNVCKSNENTILSMFQEIVKVSGNTIALRSGEDQISYKELEDRSNQLAHYLLDRGVVKGAFIPISMNRSFDLIIGILGILKTGAVYVPIDATYPKERIDFIIEDIDASLILSHSELSSVFLDSAIDIINIDCIDSVVKKYLKTAVPVTVSTEDLAYINYTSGSTGRPKGVLIPHRGVARLSQIDVVSLDKNTKMLQLSSISFDAATFEIWGCLLNGGELIVYTPDQVDISEINNHITKYSINTIWLTAALFDQWVLSNISELPLQYVLSGGDILSPHSANQLYNKHKTVVLINGYGPTENTTFTCCHQVPRDIDPTRSIPIGKPIPGTNIYVLTQDMNICPIGVVGELYTAGLGVSKGYLNLDDLTKERFVTNPFDDSENSILYKTGDLVRWLPDGTIAFIGRKDTQVKIRGYRIELGEIEYQLNQVEGIAQSFVMTRGNDTETKSIVAYMIVNKEIDQHAIATVLQEKLPSYMLPQYYIFLDTFPLTPNGKINKRLLPAPDHNSSLTHNYVAPETDLEQHIASIWQEVLSIEKVGIHDNFFAIGGHSLMAVRLISRIKDVLAMHLKISLVFNHPTIHELCIAINKESVSSLPAILKEEREESVPLSFSQERLWFLDQLSGTSNYHMAIALRIHGNLKKEILTNSLQIIIERHEPLRTVFKEEKGIGYQHLLSASDFAIKERVHTSKNISIEAYVAKLVQEAFDLSNDFMIRGVLIPNNKEQVFVITMHHIASDGWSIPIFIKELETCYNAICEEKNIELQPLPVQYSDYSVWQRKYISGDFLKEKMGYWMDQLEDVPTLNLSTDYKRPPVQSTQGAMYTFTLNSEITEKLKAYSVSKECTLFMTLLGIYKVLLYKYTNQNDICIGTPVANREQHEIATLIGYFVNTIALRTTINTKDSFDTFLDKVREVTLSGYDHQDVPLERVVDALELKRDQSRTPLFQTMLALQNNEQVHTISLKDVEVTSLPFEHTTATFDLSFDITEKENGMDVAIEYCTDLFKEDTIRRMGAHFTNLIHTILLDSTIKIADISMLSKDEKRILTEEFTTTVDAYPDGETVIDLFQKQVASNPDAIALSFEGTTLTYKELNEKADFLANDLHKKHVKAEDCIGICVERSLDLIIGVLGILKSGAAYVPIDPTLPNARIQYILEDTKASIVLTQQELSSLFTNKEVEVLCIDTLSFDPEEQLLETKKPVPKGHHLAYIIYTSGSTGKPKGVCIEHKNLHNLVLAQSEAVGVTRDTNILQFASFSFDVFAGEVFGALSHGAKLVLISKETMLATDRIEKVLEDEQIEIIDLPVVYGESLKPERLSSLKTVIFGGERVPQSLITRWQPFTTVINAYGPTETTVTATLTTTPIKDNKVSIGKPLKNVQVYIVDEQLSLVPIGVTGELCIAGQQVARGYHNNEERTREAFVSNPFVTDKEARLYKSGDLARWLPDGSIEFLGRKDEQVKIRGFRIELGEIETTLNKLPQVKNTAVIVKEIDSNTKQLVAFVEPAKTTDFFDKEIIQNQLQQLLPSYMVPSIYHVVENFKLTSGGKIDRKSLENKTIDITTTTTESYVAPFSTVQKQIIKIWEELLHVSPIGIEDNFFELGGDSIKAIQLVSRAKERGLYIRVKDIFDHQTIAAITENLQEEIVVIKEEGILTGDVGLLPIQKEFFATPYEDINHYNQSMLLDIDKNSTYEEVSKVLQTLSKHHDALRFVYKKEEDTIQQVYGKQIILVEEKQVETKEELTALCEFYQRSLSIYTGESAKFVWIKTADNEEKNRLFMAVHHLLIDGVSWRILFEDLQKAMVSIKNNQPINLGNKYTSYRQWSQKLSEYANEGIEASEVAYWTTIINNRNEFPQDFDYKGSTIYEDVKNHDVIINNTITTAVLTKVHEVYNTEINDILLAALTLTLSEWGGTKNVTIALEGHGREELFEDVDISRTVGWFTTVFPVVLSAPKEKENLSELIIETKENLRKIPNRGIGYGVLEYLSSQKQLPNNEISFDQIVFNYLGNFDTSIKDGMINFSKEDKGNDISLLNANPHKIAINCMVIDGKLQLRWSYDSKRYKAITIQQLATQFNTYLEEIVSHCKTQKTVVKTVSDYMLPATITQKELEAFKQLPSHSAEIVDIAILSPLQEGILFHSIFDDTPGAYVVQFSFDFVNGIDIPLFKESWEKLFKKHAILRTTIHAEYFEVPVQCVYGEVDFPLEIIDYSHLTGNALAEAINSFLISDKEQGFDLTKAPLVRFTILKLPENRMKLVITDHHILWDGWSFSILMSSFITNYMQKREQEPLRVGEDNYIDFIRHIHRKKTKEATGFWKKYLSSLKAPSYIPFTKNSDQKNTVFANTISDLTIDNETTKSILQYSQQYHLTLNTIVQGIWSYLLSKYTRQDTVTFGTTISGRNVPVTAIENRVGLYINTIPVCTTLTHEPLAQWLQQLQSSHTTAREEYGYIPLGKIQSYTHIKEALFDSLLVFENYPVDENTLNVAASLQIENVKAEDFTNYTISISIVQQKETILIKFAYNPEIITHESIHRIQQHFHELFKSFCKPETYEIDSLNYITEKEQTTILQDFNKSERAYPKEETVLDMLAKQAKNQPDQVALIYEDQKISYRELEEQSNQIANYLISKNVERGAVPIYMNRSLEMVISIFGVLKSGNAYVPISPSYPAHRVAYILEDCQSKLFLSTIDTESLHINKNIEVVHITRNAAEIQACDIERPTLAIDQDHLGYIIYTSGTTGNPKGVEVYHKTVTCLLYGMANQYPLTGNDKLLLKTNFTFDVSVYELFGWLVHGNSLVILPEETETDIEKTVAIIDKEKITHLNMVPSLFATMITTISEEAIATKFNSVKHVMLAGEALSPGLVNKYKKIGFTATLSNIYGPTEATVYTSHYTIPKNQDTVDVVPIGKPLDNVSLYILDTNKKIVPVDVIGELYIGGSQLAKGYRNLPELTNEKFIQNPFETDQSRLYKTGDLARWLPDGNIEFLGRKDHQVKIRGYRIELGEIESCLDELSEIKQSVVVAQKDVDKEAFLVAYYTPITNIEKGDIVQKLKEKLPSYMIPQIYVPLEKIPLNTNGKVDRKALPIFNQQALVNNEYVAPETTTQKKLVNIWQELLSIDKIGIHDNFFDLGGHSLLAIKMMTKIKHLFDIRLSIKVIFENQTIKELSVIVNQLSNNNIAKDKEYTDIII